MTRICCAGCANPDTREHVITDRTGRPWRFEMNRFCGPIVLRQDGSPKARQPGERSPFWTAFEVWLQTAKPAKQAAKEQYEKAQHHLHEWRRRRYQS